jgi:predicted aspartyl protease
MRLGVAKRLRLLLQSLVLAGAISPGAAEAPAGSVAPQLDSHVESAAGHLPPAGDLLFASPTRLDHIGRIVVPVMVNGQGPFRFIVDTGASWSTVSPQLARTLGLSPSAELPMRVNGITGTADVPSVTIHRLQAGELVLENTRFPVVWAPLMAGADGILGVAGLKRRISVDFLHNRVIISRSPVGGTPPGFDRVPARLVAGGLLVVSARVGGVRVEAVIDTGSERTIGNTALRDALAWRRRKGEVARVTDVYGATTEVASGEINIAPTIDFGSVKISNVTVVYGDFHIFEVWGLRSRPAVIIGMDVLGTVNALAIDFQRCELYVDSVFHMG